MVDDQNKENREPQTDKRKTNEDGDAPGSGGGFCADYEAEDVFENAEPWDPIETKIVLGSFGAALVFLGIFAYLIHKYILG